MLIGKKKSIVTDKEVKREEQKRMTSDNVGLK